ncbi:hypothetical protein H0G86_003263 [Trichoderma simmonsii]|uniref:DNA2/NAM7 helicase helicase domain-containing protein n=1 Tax=Trichoderma simmonsii TaxID=1491479 RepID=A0A8G0PE92_9HYPO|nr:hypothetical protein H0G86_003263 [Trichoderma simmonsii]
MAARTNPFRIVVVDEAGRLTEAMSLVPFAQHPDVPVIFIGDTRQFGPMVATAGDRNYKALWKYAKLHASSVSTSLLIIRLSRRVERLVSKRDNLQR